MHRLHLRRGVRLSPTSVLDKTNEVPVILELWGMRSNSSLPSLSGPLRLGVVVPERVLSMDQIELNCVLMLN